MNGREDGEEDKQRGDRRARAEDDAVTEKISNKLLTVNEVASILRVSNMTVYRLVKSGQIPAIRVGKNYRIKESDVNKYLSRGS